MFDRYEEPQIEANRLYQHIAESGSERAEKTLNGYGRLHRETFCCLQPLTAAVRAHVSTV